MRTQRGRLFALALQLVGRRADAEDVVQDSLLRAHRSLRNFRGQCALRSWLFQITINRALTHRQRRARTQGVLFEDDRVHAALAVDAGHDPHLALELRERYARLLSALDRLPPTLRATVVLVTSQGLSLDEAGQMLGCSGGTVGWRVHEARKLLRHFLTESSGVRNVSPRRPSAPVTKGE